MKKTLADRLLGRKAAHPFTEMIPDIEQWFHSRQGEEILQDQQKFIDEQLSTLFGYHLMQISACRDVCLYENSKIQHKFSINPLAGEKIAGVADEEQLPIENESIDVALIHHAMEYTQQPHQLLKELSRVVVPSGYLLVVGFNPRSLIGLWSLISLFKHKGIWQHNLLGIRRLADWLTLMDFSVQSVQYGYYKSPANTRILPKFFNKIAAAFHRLQLPCGGYYIVLAKKEVMPLTPVKQRWRDMGKSIIPVMEPSLYTSDKGKKPTIH